MPFMNLYQIEAVFHFETRKFLTKCDKNPPLSYGKKSIIFKEKRGKLKDKE